MGRLGRRSLVLALIVDILGLCRVVRHQVLEIILVIINSPQILSEVLKAGQVDGLTVKSIVLRQVVGIMMHGELKILGGHRVVD